MRTRVFRMPRNFAPSLFAGLGSLAVPVALAVAVPAGVACHSSSSTGSPAAATGVVPRFDLTSNPTPNFMDVPFPTDVYLQNGRVIDIPGMDAVVKQNSDFISHELAKMDGFSRVALSLFYVDDLSAGLDDNGDPTTAAVDPTTLPADEASCVADTSAVFLVDLDATDPAKARVACRALWHVDYAYKRSRPLLAVGPANGIVLQPAHHYAAVVTSRVKTTDGRSLQASGDFSRVQKGDTSVPPVYADAYTKVTAALGGALSGDGAQVVALAPFTTHDMAKQLYALRDALEAAPAPALAFDQASMAPMAPSKFAQKIGGQLPTGFTASLDDWLGVTTKKLPDGSDDPDADLPVRAHDQIAVVGTGVFQATNYLQHYYDSSNYNSLDHATFALDPGGNPVPAPDHPSAKIWVSLAIPRAMMPASGYPTIIFQHGLGGSRDEFLQIANPLCKAGWMVVAIDSITFGARAPEASWQVDMKSDFASSPGATYKGPDGFGDADSSGAHNGSNDLFGGLIDVGALRDQFRQAEIDTAQLVKVLRSSPDLSALAWNGVMPKIDPDRIGYIGQSLGAIEGAGAAAIEPHVQSWTLNVAGASVLTELATHSPIVYNLLQLAAFANFGFPEATLDEGHVATTLIQTVMDPGDPVDFAGYLVTSPQPLAGQPTKPRNVLQFEVLYDEWVPNEADEALARAGGWGLAQPNAGSNADILDYKNLMNDKRRLPLASVAPGSDGSIHDTPAMGVTAIVVQASSATHGENLISSSGQREFCIPYANYASGTAFNHLDQDKYFTVPEPYLETQKTVVQFFSDTFAGKVPRVVVNKTPVRDLDADQVTDDVDPDPCNPNVK
jgi:dienelactone hydrolase